MMPTAASFEAADSAQIPVPADSPKDHSDKHALVNLDQEFFYNASARIRIEDRKQRPSVKPHEAFATRTTPAHDCHK